MNKTRFTTSAGIAIGPILFIIAILAILAAAIAAGSGSFTAGTSTESNNTKASAIIQIGENLKVGMDRMMMENNIAFGAYTINSTNTINNNDLFSPTGGGITVPSVTMANAPATDAWLYPTAPVPKIGTNNAEQLAVLHVSAAVCDSINLKTNNLSATPAAAALGDFTSINALTTATTNNWPTALQGHPIGCVNNSTNTADYFYEVLYSQ